MKYWFFILTLIVYLVSVVGLTTLFDNFNQQWLIAGFLIVFFTGIILRAYPNTKNQTVKDLGWGLFFGSLFTLLSFVVFLMLIALNIIKLT
jgi:hypothetical protein